MNLIFFGLSITSSWGNGHATTYRALIRALAQRGHHVLFMERDQPWYAEHRDLPQPSYCETILYHHLSDIAKYADRVADADAVIVGSYVPDGITLGRSVTQLAHGVSAFYDIDTPVTLAQLGRGVCPYLSPELVGAYDLYLSFSGGPILEVLEKQYGSPSAKAFYCSVDAEAYSPNAVDRQWELGYLGTYSEDRQPALEKLLLKPARQLAEKKFAVAGPQYPADGIWPDNVTRIEHLSPDQHRDFYGAQKFTLNITREQMRAFGWSPSVRLFEAAACGTPIISDRWDGLAELLTPGEEILIADTSSQVVEMLRDLPETDRNRIAAQARTKVLAAHTADHRAAELEQLIASVSPNTSRLRSPRGRAAAPPLSQKVLKPSPTI